MSQQSHIPESRIPGSAASTSRTPISKAQLIVLSLLAAVLAFGGFAPGIAGADTADEREGMALGLVGAWNGSGWLSGQLAAGVPLQNFGGPDWGVTLDAGIAVAATDSAFGTTDDHLAALWAAVLTDRETVVAPYGSDDPGRLAKVILLATALGEDPAAVGSEPRSDLVNRLSETREVTGKDAGLFGSGDPTYDGAYRQSLAIRALHSAGVVPAAEAVSWLIGQQCADGSWMPYRSDLGAACAYDAAAYVGPDSNSTAAAVDALRIVGASDSPLVWTDGIQWLVDNMNDDGGWGYFPGDDSDPNSTALGVQALVTPQDRLAFGAGAAALMMFQISCDEQDHAGAFETQWAAGEGDLLATVQSVAALALEGSVGAGEAIAIDIGMVAPAAACVDPEDLVNPATTVADTSTTVAVAAAANTTSEVPPASADSADVQEEDPATTVADTSTTVAVATAANSTSEVPPAATTPASLAHTGGGTSVVTYGWFALILGALLIGLSRPAVRAAMSRKQQDR